MSRGKSLSHNLLTEHLCIDTTPHKRAMGSLQKQTKYVRCATNSNGFQTVCGSYAKVPSQKRNSTGFGRKPKRKLAHGELFSESAVRVTASQHRSGCEARRLWKRRSSWVRASTPPRNLTLQTRPASKCPWSPRARANCFRLAGRYRWHERHRGLR